MLYGTKKERVKLLVDLTRYDLRCKIGELGWAIPDLKVGIWGSEDRFCGVIFDNGAKLDVLFSSLKFISAKK